jgi:hypothetical protein
MTSFRQIEANRRNALRSTGPKTLVLGPQQEEGLDGEDDVCSSLPISVRDLTCCFLRLSNVDNGAFERLGRYNAALWKQTAQTLLLLHAIRKPLAKPARSILRIASRQCTSLV